MRELKLERNGLQEGADRRTPPGVRELKLALSPMDEQEATCRTPPGVRELKLRLVLGLFTP